MTFKSLLLNYILPIVLALATWSSEIYFLQDITQIIADIFIRVFSFLSIPIISLALMVTILSYNLEDKLKQIGFKALIYTICTTIIAASVTCIIYVIIDPTPLEKSFMSSGNLYDITSTTNIKKHLINLVPSNFLEPFVENKLISSLLIAIVFGFAVRKIKNDIHRSVITNFIQALYEIFITIANWVLKLLPIALYAFITNSLVAMKNISDFKNLYSYLIIVISANLFQGLVVLPLWLKINNISPIKIFKGVNKALVVAFFSKSSTSTLPITINNVENNLKISPTIAKTILPMCTVINMNGCATFIFATVIYIAQSNGIILQPIMMVAMIFISTIAAIGNAGVPMGCFFLSASIIAALGLPIEMLGIILPFYTIIDMVETALNVWSDICVTAVVDKDFNTQH